MDHRRVRAIRTGLRDCGEPIFLSLYRRRFEFHLEANLTQENVDRFRHVQSLQSVRGQDQVAGQAARVLRDAGLTVTTTQIEDVARALASLGVQDRERTFRVCRALLVKRKDDLGLFERLFRWFWRDPLDLAGAGPMRVPEAPRHKTPGSGQFTIATYMAYPCS